MSLEICIKANFTGIWKKEINWEIKVWCNKKDSQLPKTNTWNDIHKQWSQNFVLLSIQWFDGCLQGFFFTSKLYLTKQSKTKNIKIPLQAFLLLIPIKRKSMWRLHNSWTLHIIELRCQCILAYNNFRYQSVKNAQKIKILLAMVFGYSKCESGHVTHGRCWCETEYR